MFNKVGDVEVETVKLVKYRLDEDWNSIADASGDAAVARATKYDMQATGFFGLQRSLGMAPVNFGSPRHYKNPDERAKILGLTPDDWEAGGEDTLGTFLDAEPLTGQVMNNAQQFAFSIKINKAQMNGLYDKLYPHNSMYHVYFPMLWTEDVAAIPTASALHDIRGIGV